MTKLTKQSRLDIIESVVKNTNLPKQKEALVAKVGPVVREAIRKLLPKMFEKTAANMPEGWLCSMDTLRILKFVNPVSLISGEGSEYSSKEVNFEPLLIPARFPELLSIKATIKAGNGLPNNEYSWEKILEKEIKEAKLLCKKEEDLRYDIAAFLASVSTHAQVIAKMPELERHLPIAPGKNYPVVVSVTKLVNLLDGYGFDLGVKL